MKILFSYQFSHNGIGLMNACFVIHSIIGTFPYK